LTGCYNSINLDQTGVFLQRKRDEKANSGQFLGKDKRGFLEEVMPKNIVEIIQVITFSKAGYILRGKER